MSKKKIYSKHLRKGTFHLHNDKNGGHPALILEKNDKKNIYKLAKFTHKARKNRFKLKHNIDPNSNKDTYVHSEPIYSVRKNISSKELDRYRIHKDDKPLINRIKKMK